MGKSRTMYRTGRRMAEATEEGLGQMRDSASEYYERGRDKISDLAHTMEDSIREQPVRWFLLGIGLGCLIGAMIVDR